MATFDYLRISLARTDLPLLDYAEATGEEQDRESFLRQVFAEEIRFRYGRREYGFVPLDVDGPFIVGSFGRELQELIHDGPEQKFSTARRERWEVALFFLDPRDGVQIAAFQRAPGVGSPRRVLRAFFEEISLQGRADGWSSFFEYIASADDFWAVAERYRGHISEILFRFVPPNALRARDALNDLLRSASRDANSDEVDLRLRNRDQKGIAAGDLVEEGVETAVRGGGEVKIKSNNRTVYSSSSKKKSEHVDEGDLPPENNASMLAKFAEYILSLVKN